MHCTPAGAADPVETCRVQTILLGNRDSHCKTASCVSDGWVVKGCFSVAGVKLKQ